MVRKWKTCASLGWKALAAGLTVTACAQILGLDAPEGIRATDGAVADSEVDANVPVPTPAGCKDRKIDLPESVIFVAADKGKDAADCGGPTNPCQTINRGLAQAQAASRDRVIVGSGNYAEAVLVSSAVTLEGRWKSVVGGQWQPACGGTRADLSVVKPPADTPRGVSVTPATAGAAITLRYLRVETPDASAKPVDRSSYGIYAKDAVLAVDTVDLVVGKGAKADAPVAPTASGNFPRTAPDACNGGENAPVAKANGAAGAAGGDAVATSAFGEFRGDGYHPGDGARGKSGADGQNGGTTDAPTPLNSCQACQGNGTCAAAPGVVGARGLRGCGGVGGAGGPGGAGGGGSFGIFAWSTPVTVTAVTIATADGAPGLPGVPGAAGGGGESPAAGADAMCTTSCSPATLVPLAACSTGAAMTSKATAPTKGGAGGKGANGADGGGGPSLGIFLGEAAKVTFLDDSKSSIVFGKAGENANAAIPAAPAAAIYPEAP